MRKTFPKPPARDRLLTTREVSELLQVTRQSVSNWVRQGYIRAAFTPGGHARIRIGDLVRFLEESQMPIPSVLKSQLRRRLMLIDDDATVLRAMQRSLKQYDEFVEIMAVQRGIDALLQIEGFSPHVIVLDQFMPGLDGLEVCRRLKARKETKEIIVSLMSANLTPELEAAAKSAGAVRCFEKPVDPGELLDLLEVDRLAAALPLVAG